MKGCFFVDEYTSNTLETEILSEMKRKNPKNYDKRHILRNLWRKINVSSKPYVDRQLGDSEYKGFFAAGVFPFLRVRNHKTKVEELSVLFVREHRGGKSEYTHFNFLGGKREMKETPNHTVFREFLEETDGTLSDKQKSSLQKQLKVHHCEMWFASGRYILKGISCPKSWASLPEKFVNHRKRQKAKHNPKFRRKTRGLVWVPLEKLTKVWHKLSSLCKDVCSTQQFMDFLGIYCKSTKQSDFFRKFELKIPKPFDGTIRKIDEAENEQRPNKRIRV